MNHPDDEVLSALLDGEAPPGDVAHADGCATCQERIGELRAVSLLVATPVALPAAHVREAAFSAALGTLAAPARTPVPTRRVNSLSAAAVLLVALAVGGLLITQVGRSHPDRSTSSNTASLAQGIATTVGNVGDRSAGGSADAGTLAAPAAGASVASSGGANSPPYDAGELGTVATIDDVIQRAAADLDQPSDVKAEHGMSAPSPCPYETGGTSLWQATLQFDGEAAVAHAFQTDSGRIMQILRRADCSVLVRRGF